MVPPVGELTHIKETNMAMNSLKDIYLDQLQDIWSANTQSLPVVTELGRAAKDEELSEALIDGGNGIAEGIAEIEKLCNDHGIKPNAEHCKGMEGLVKEAHKHAIDSDLSGAALDVAIIAQYQRMCHYGIAGFGTTKAFAEALGENEAASKLDQALDDIYESDSYMSELAERSRNVDAMAD